MSDRCEDGRLMRHAPGPEDPYCEVYVGICPRCDGKGCDLRLTDIQVIVLKAVHEDRVSDLRTMSEPMRQAVIDLGMMEPPLIDVMADAVFLTSAGDEALRSAT